MMPRNAYTAHAFKVGSKFRARVLKHGEVVALSSRLYATALNALKAARTMLDKLLAPVAPRKVAPTIARVPAVQWAKQFMARCENNPRIDIAPRPRFAPVAPALAAIDFGLAA